MPKYVHKGDVRGGLNFTQGKWLLNTVEAPWPIENDLTQTAVHTFQKLLGHRFSTVEDQYSLILNKMLPDHLDASVLMDIKTKTGFDYFIDIRAKKIKNEMGDFQIGTLDSDVENKGTVTLRVYDLNLQKQIYTQTVEGTLFAHENRSEFAFAKSANNLIRAGLQKMLKKIKKNQVK